jgi:hypothetical protein
VRGLRPRPSAMYQNSPRSVAMVAAVTVLLLALIITIAILWHHQQKLRACERIGDNAARIICIGEQ